MGHKVVVGTEIYSRNFTRLLVWQAALRLSRRSPDTVNSTMTAIKKPATICTAPKERLIQWPTSSYSMEGAEI